MRERIKQSEVVPGLTLVTMETGVKDVVSFGASLLAGSRFDARFSIADITARMLKEGTEKHSKRELNDILESHSINFAFSSTTTRSSVAGRIPSRELDLGLELLAEMWQKPFLGQAEFDMLKKRVQTELLQEKQDTRASAARRLTRETFAPDHPNFTPDFDIESAEVNALSLEEVRRFHAAHYGLGSVFVTITGDVDHDKVAKQLAKHFAKWRSATSKYEPVRAGLSKGASKTILTMPDKASVDLCLGIGAYIDIHAREYFALQVGLAILGGSDFSARLMNTVREKEGLTYGIRGGLGGVYYADSGNFVISGMFAPVNFAKGLELTKELFSRWANKGVTNDELTRRKRMMTGEYLVGLADSSGVQAQLMAMLEQGRDLAFIDEYPKIIESLKLTEVNAAIKKYIHPSKLVIVAAGSIDQKGKPLTK